MSQKIIYTCNICTDERDVKDLQGVYFTTHGDLKNGIRERHKRISARLAQH